MRRTKRLTKRIGSYAKVRHAKKWPGVASLGTLKHLKERKLRRTRRGLASVVRIPKFRSPYSRKRNNRGPKKR